MRNEQTNQGFVYYIYSADLRLIATLDLPVEMAQDIVSHWKLKPISPMQLASMLNRQKEGTA